MRMRTFQHPSPANPPARNIVPSVRGITGNVPNFGKYESSLERDFMEILRFDPEIEEFTPQPLTLEYCDQNGNLCRYTPDGLIKFKKSAKRCLQPILFEIKYREDFRKDWRTLMPKFRAAKSHSLVRGWRFEVFTEREIRTTYLKNVKFLWQFVDRLPEPSMVDHVLKVLSDLDEADAELLLCALCNDKNNRAAFIPIIWHMVAIGLIDCNLEEPLNMRSILTLPGVENEE